MEEKNIQNLSENDQTGSDRSMQQHDAKAKYMQTDFNAQIGEADTWLDKAKTLVRQNKLAAFSALLIIFMILIQFLPLWWHLMITYSRVFRTACSIQVRFTGLEPTSWGVMCSAVSFLARAFP